MCADGARIYILNFVNDMLYYETDSHEVQGFKAALKKRFNLELMGQVHRHLGTCISQLANHEVFENVSRSCLLIQGMSKTVRLCGRILTGKNQNVHACNSAQSV
jgi:hypothetical protein